jgi:TRAP-type C4-dicarboxylate transport system permease small subunit
MPEEVDAAVEEIPESGRLAGVLNWVISLTNVVSSIALACIMLLVVADVVARLFSKSILGSIEVTEYLLAVVVAMALASSNREKAHVKVEFLVDRLPKRFQPVPAAFGALLFLAMFALIAWQMISRGLMNVGENPITSASLGIPEAPFDFLVVAGTVVLCIGLIADIVGYLTGRTAK